MVAASAKTRSPAKRGAGKPSRRSKKDDGDYDVNMDADDAFDEPSFGMKKPPRPRSKPGTPRYVPAPFPGVSPRISSGFASRTSR